MKPAVLNTASPLEVRQVLDEDLLRLLTATLRNERLNAAMHEDVAKVQRTHAPAIAKASKEIAALEADIQKTYTANRDALEDGKKSLQLRYGLLGMRAPSNPALIPLDAKWNWKRIAEAVKKVWKSKYMAQPKSVIDKVKIKQELTAVQLARAGMKLDDSENFYLELNRLAQPCNRRAVEADEAKEAASA